MAETPLQNRLRAVRVRLGRSQQELAQAAGVTRQTVGGIEGGQYAPSATVALRLARALGCQVEDLFWLEEETATLEAAPVEDFASAGEAQRLVVGRVGGRWLAHPLSGENAFRTEMVPADGVGEQAVGDERVRVELLEDPAALERTVLLAGCTPALSLWSRAAERWHPGLRVHWTFANSREALRRLARGEVHAAGLHLWDAEREEFNAPFVREALGGQPALLVNLGVWEEGLALPPGNPRRLRQVEDLARPDVEIVNREEGAGARLLLEQSLEEAGVPSHAVRGYRRSVPGHLEVAREVAAGRADAGVTTSAVAAAFGLAFLPLRAVRYDLALRREALNEEPVRQLLASLDHRWMRSQLQVLVGYDTSRTGEVVAEIAG